MPLMMDGRRRGDFKTSELRIVLLCLAGIFVVAGHLWQQGEFNQVQAGEKDEKKAEEKGSDKTNGQWNVLYKRPKFQVGNHPIPKNAPIKVVKDLEFEGPCPSHPFLLGNFKINGGWGLSNGYLKPVTGTNTAISLGRAANFELQGVLTTRDKEFGGLFLLLGWDKGHGYVIHNVQMKSGASGSPWLINELRGSKRLAGADAGNSEFKRFSLKDRQPFVLQVKDKRLSLYIGNKTLIEDMELSNYHEGEIILGTYDTRYGPRPLLVEALRIRTD